MVVSGLEKDRRIERAKLLKGNPILEAKKRQNLRKSDMPSPAEPS